MKMLVVGSKLYSIITNLFSLFNIIPTRPSTYIITEQRYQKFSYHENEMLLNA